MSNERPLFIPGKRDIPRARKCLADIAAEEFRFFEALEGLAQMLRKMASPFAGMDPSRIGHESLALLRQHVSEMAIFFEIFTGMSWTPASSGVLDGAFGLAGELDRFSEREVEFAGHRFSNSLEALLRTLLQLDSAAQVNQQQGVKRAAREVIRVTEAICTSDFETLRAATRRECAALRSAYACSPKRETENSRQPDAAPSQRCPESICFGQPSNGGFVDCLSEDLECDRADAKADHPGSGEPPREVSNSPSHVYTVLMPHDQVCRRLGVEDIRTAKKLLRGSLRREGRLWQVNHSTCPEQFRSSFDDCIAARCGTIQHDGAIPPTSATPLGHKPLNTRHGNNAALGARS